MGIGIKYVTACAGDWLLFLFLYHYLLYDLAYFLIIWISCDVCKWHYLETRDGFPLRYVTRKRRSEQTEVLTCSKKSHENQTIVHLCLLICGSFLRDVKSFTAWF